MMRLYKFWILFFILNASSVDVKVGEARRLPAVESLISSLQQERWSEDQLCLRATLHWLTALRNRTLWAAWIWDSMQPPVGTLIGNSAHLGNFDQCLQFPWTSSHPDLQPQYCIVDVATHARDDTQELDAFDDAEEFYQMPSKYGRYNNRHEVGVCLPAACGAAGAARVYRHMVRDTLLAAGDVTVDVTVDYRDCHTVDHLKGFSGKFYVFWCVIGILLTTAFLCTYFNWNNNCSKNRFYIDIITRSFCMRRNYNDLFTVNNDDIRCMNGMRFLTAALIVIIHDGYYSMRSPVVNTLAMNQLLSTPLGKITLQSAAVVDTFFTMSGLLLMRSLMMGDKSLLVMMIKRYIRLIGPLAIAILYINTAMMDMESGPYWRRANRFESEVCKNDWWMSLLMINCGVNAICHVVTWYIPNDYQLSVLVIFLFYLYKKNRTAGVTSAVVISTAMSLYLGFEVYRKKLPYIAFNNAHLLNFHEDPDLVYHYVKIDCHSGPYFIGVFFGYVMATYKPRDYRNVISKKWSTILTLIALVNLISVMLIVGVLCGSYDPLLASMVVTLGRICWGLAVCCIIGACEYGSVSVPLINNILSWPGFVPLSKLSYCMYMLHTFLIQKEKYYGRTLGIFSYFLMFKNGFGVVVISLIFSIILYLIVEAPLIHISKYLFHEKSKPSENGCSKTLLHNGNHRSKNSEEKTKIL